MNVEQVKYNIKFQMNGLVLAQSTKHPHPPTVTFRALPGHLSSIP